MAKGRKFLIIIIILVFVLFIGTSFALYIINLSQDGTNALHTDCFEISYTDKNYISLDQTIPIKDEEYNSLVPYEFTVKNICNTNMSFNIALEKLNTSTMDEVYLRYKLNDDDIGTIGNKEETTIKTKNAVSSHIIGSSILFGGQSKTYNLRIWLDYNSTMEQSANKTYASKVVVTSVVNKDKFRDIAFNLDGGVMDDNVYHYIDGRTYDLLPNPTKDGYVFGGWYKDSELTEKVVESDIVSEDVTQLYAKWISEDFTIIYDYNYLENDIFDQYWYRDKPAGALASSAYKIELYDDPLGVSYHISFTALQNASGKSDYHGVYFQVKSSDNTLVAGDKYVVQFDAKACKNLSIAIGPEQGYYHEYALTTEWKHYTYIFNASTNGFNAFIFYTKEVEINEKFNLDIRNIYFTKDDSLNTTSLTRKYNSKLGEMPQVPQRDGYRFVGWYDDPINGNRVDSNTIVPYSDDGKFNVYARWLLV